MKSFFLLLFDRVDVELYALYRKLMQIMHVLGQTEVILPKFIFGHVVCKNIENAH